ncbi:glycosyltransferase [Marinicauda salina]|nr:glycosyltransferase [Marinicauda salina]
MADARTRSIRSHAPSSRTRARQAWRAAFHLIEHRPEASARSRLSPPAALIAGPGLFALGATLLAPGVMLIAAGALGGAVFAAVSLLRLAAALAPPRYDARRPLSDEALPAVSVIAALHREAEVVGDLCAHLAATDYPADRLEILLAIEADDAETLAAAHAAAARCGARVIEIAAVGPRTKPKALNVALAEARGELVAVYDAEDAPAPDQLRAAAEAFAADARLGCMQAPLGWYNRGETWLTGQFALEYAAHFHALLPLCRRLGWPLPLGGTSNVFRRSALEACGAWDPFNVTEDADLGFRLARDGWRCGLIEPGTLEEAPVARAAWTAQRSRWLKGHLATWLVQMRDPRGLAAAAGPGGVLALQLTLGANVLSAMIHAPATLGVLLGAGAWAAGLVSGWPVAVAAAGLATGYACAMAAAASGARRAGFTPRPRAVAAMPAYWLLQWPAMLRALRELAAAPYVWAKTRHGVSRVAREPVNEPDRHRDPDDRRTGSVRAGGVARRPARRPA